MKLHERLALMALAGAVLAYVAGLLTIRISHDETTGMFVAFIIEIAALVAGWTWAKAGER